MCVRVCFIAASGTGLTLPTLRSDLWVFGTVFKNLRMEEMRAGMRVRQDPLSRVASEP